MHTQKLFGVDKGMKCPYGVERGRTVGSHTYMYTYIYVVNPYFYVGVARMNGLHVGACERKSFYVNSITTISGIEFNLSLMEPPIPLVM